MECAGCEARDREIAFLRAQVEKLQDKAFELARPAQPMPLTAPGPAIATENLIDPALVRRGDDGVMRYSLNGQEVLLDVVLRAMKEGGGIDPSGNYVSREEHTRAMDMLSRQLSGG